MTLLHRKSHPSLGPHYRFLSILICLLMAQTSASANKDVAAVLHSKESMQDHISDEPRRLMHDVLLEEFGKGNVVKILNPENAPQPAKYRPTDYHVAANLIAFSSAPNVPTNVSLSIQLVKNATGRVILTSDRAIFLDPKLIESGLKLKKPEFDRSQYGQAIIMLSRGSVKTFEDKVVKLNL